jgi:hypothetical protein
MDTTTDSSPTTPTTTPSPTSTTSNVTTDLPPEFNDSISAQFHHNITNPLMVPVLMVSIPVYNGYMASVEFGKEIWKKITD